MHFTPTSASWINQVERFFGLITGAHPLRRVHSVAELETAIGTISISTTPIRTFRLDQSAADILEKGRQRATSVRVTTLDVDRAEPWPDGQDRQEDQALPV